MRLSTLLSASLAVLTLSCLSAANADERNYPGPGGSNRGLFGMPAARQWMGARPMTMRNGYGDQQGNCPNGRCGTGSCPNGQCAPGVCENGQCANGNCLNGQCGTGNCPNGQCGTGPGSRMGSASCPNGYCGVNGMTGRLMRPSNDSAQTNWSPRSTRGLADPYRRAGSAHDDSGWVQRTMRPVFEPVNDTFRSRYSEEEMDLNSGYFRGRSETDRDSSDRFNRDEVRPSSRDWNSRGGRSLEAPAPASRSTRI